MHERTPKRSQSQERAAERSPQTDDEEGTQSDAEYVQQSSCERRSTAEPTDRNSNRRAPGYETDQQEPDPGRAVGECGVEPTHSVRRLWASCLRLKDPNGRVWTHFRGPTA
jgi:hypothetical protein